MKAVVKVMGVVYPDPGSVLCTLNPHKDPKSNLSHRQGLWLV